MPAEKVTSLSPWHVVLIIDDSGSMGEQIGGRSAASYVNDGLIAMISTMEVLAKGTKPYFKISIVAFGSSAEILAEAKSERVIDIDKIATFAGRRGGTRPSDAFRLATDILRRNPGATTDFRPYVFFFSDGRPDDQDRASALQAATELKSLGIAAGNPTIWALGYGDVDRYFMNEVCSVMESGEPRFKVLLEASALSRLFPIIGTSATGTEAEVAIDRTIMSFKNTDIMNL